MLNGAGWNQESRGRADGPENAYKLPRADRGVLGEFEFGQTGLREGIGGGGKFHKLGIQRVAGRIELNSQDGPSGGRGEGGGNLDFGAEPMDAAHLSSLVIVEDCGAQQP